MSKHLMLSQEYLEDKWGYEHPVTETYYMLVKRRWDIDDYAVNAGWKLYDQATRKKWAQ